MPHPAGATGSMVHTGQGATGGGARLLMITAPGVLADLLSDPHAPGAWDRNEIAARYGVTGGDAL